MSNIWTIVKKELRRIFTDKRMLASLILPGVLIFLVYSLMGNFFVSSFTVSEEYEYNIIVFNEPSELSSIHNIEGYNINLVEYGDESFENAKLLLSSNQIDLLIVYDDDFLSKLEEETKPNVKIYYNSTSTESSLIYQQYLTIFSALSVNVTYNFYVNAVEDTYDLATNEDTSAQIITMIVPFILIILLYSGCMAISIETIAGEKERGTIATLLVTPVKRSSIALGKVISLSIASLVSSLSSFLGVILSIPKLMGELDGITLSMYGFLTYFELLILILLVVLFFTVLLLIVSTFARTVKEASQYSGPIMMIVMILAMTTLFGTETMNISLLYVIPVFNVVQCMSSIFSLSFSLVNFIITIISNVIYIILGIVLLAKMFSSEKVMFNK